MHSGPLRHPHQQRLIDLQRKPRRMATLPGLRCHNLGRYERQWWQRERLQGFDRDHRRVVLDSTAPIHWRTDSMAARQKGRGSSMWTASTPPDQGRGQGRSRAAREAGGKEVHCLAWEFEMDLRMVCQEIEASEEAGSAITIPRRSWRRIGPHPHPSSRWC